jgi:hypothetical protein
MGQIVIQSMKRADVGIHQTLVSTVSSMKTTWLP